MPSLVWTRQAQLDLARLYAFLAPKSKSAANRAVRTIQRDLKILENHPEIGRPVPELLPEYRERIIEFGHGGYVALYYYDGTKVLILEIRHGREAGY
jgi:plasmid stabilization system protein ParE